MWEIKQRNLGEFSSICARALCLVQCSGYAYAFINHNFSYMRIQQLKHCCVNTRQAVAVRTHDLSCTIRLTRLRKRAKRSNGKRARLAWMWLATVARFCLH